MNPDIMWLIVFFIFGANIGSFLNVVAYRLPEGKSIVSPPSACPNCNHQLAWYDNVPILGWLWLRGKCRYCKTPISIQYPVIEFITGFLWALLYYTYYMTDLRPGFGFLGLDATWPIFLTHIIMISALIAATIIDSKLYIIPLQIPYFVLIIALIALPLSVALDAPNFLALTGMLNDQPLPIATGAGIGAAIGGILGLGLAFVLLKQGTLKRSFNDWDTLMEQFEAEQKASNKTRKHKDRIEAEEVQEEIFYYPHPRREVLKELAFVFFPTIGIFLGMFVAAGNDPSQETAASFTQAPWLHVLAGCICGYFVGCGIVWYTRIFGTLAFGKEAMGLGDVHLLGAIGAVVGALEATLIFFVAPFIGLIAAVLMIGASTLLKGQVKVIPYGPYLAGATYVILIFRNELLTLLNLPLGN
ncbi:Type 4 prepilin-like proteins leader peptide-processing enzyme [Poriferisphaera corsica]|uniref:Type 4 prepilin-like proteins leader peptide-processing enzyme n=1 Tax=Poriferisphaera corsica TaxID=2528020 RepID=A0A517YUY0_9BACT|nr:prepilin peptidase [Poriferisphaera corsica]QDU34059.1 Type 4 prepilin-like proteins leader peptide-processing enzyme [Poriferisphaera corsica]